MRIALYSDLHLECGAWTPTPLDGGVDVVILAGDIGNHMHGLEWATKAFQQCPGSPKVLYVAGNHEYYDAHLGLLEQLEKPEWEQLGVTFLEKRTVEIHGMRFLGCTLWSDFSLYGDKVADVYMNLAKRGINDYWLIYASDGKRLEPRDTWHLYQRAVRWLDNELAKPFDGQTIVITHFAPHPRCVAPQHENSDLSPYFVTDLSRLMEKYPIALWCYGHTHTNSDFIAGGGCRVVSNQKGYPGEHMLGFPFRPDLVIEIPSIQQASICCID